MFYFKVGLDFLVQKKCGWIFKTTIQGGVGYDAWCEKQERDFKE